MGSLLSALLLFASATVFGAQTLVDFRYELACNRIGEEVPAISIHAVIEYDAKTNTCNAGNGNYFEGQVTSYGIDFTCEPPKPASLTEAHALQTWVLSAPLDGDKSRITRLAVVMHHGSEKANGFATSENGIVHSVVCKKW